MMLKQTGRINISAGHAVMAAFMAYGFLLIYLRDFAPGKAEWIASYGQGKHFEARLVHVHGNLFALLNILFGYLILKLPVTGAMAKWASWLSLGGLLMPIGIQGEGYLGLSPVFVLAGATSIVAALLVLSIAVARQSGAAA